MNYLVQLVFIVSTGMLLGQRSYDIPSGFSLHIVKASLSIAEHAIQ